MSGYIKTVLMYTTQNTLDSINNWTHENLMEINGKKSSFMIFTRAEANFTTRLNINGNVIDRLPATKSWVFG